MTSAVSDLNPRTTTHQMPRMPVPHAPAPTSPLDDRTDERHLVIVQDDRVVCVVEAHRLTSATTVARLICRLLVSEARIYACPHAHAQTLVGGQSVPSCVHTWRELFRASPWADPVADVVGVH